MRSVVDQNARLPTWDDVRLGQGRLLEEEQSSSDTKKSLSLSEDFTQRAWSTR